MALAFSHNTKKRPTVFLQLGAGGKLKNNFEFGHSSTQKERVLGWKRGGTCVLAYASTHLLRLILSLPILESFLCP